MPRQTKQSRITAARIQRAVTGFQIPLTLVVLLHKRLENAITAGADDARLSQVVAEYLAK
jgi:hypothetical protein